jgi:hypothetical protein
VNYHIGLTKNTKEIAATNVLAASELALIDHANKQWKPPKSVSAERNLFRRSATNITKCTKSVKITSGVVSVKSDMKFVGANQKKKANQKLRSNMSVMNDSAKSVWVISCNF